MVVPGFCLVAPRTGTAAAIWVCGHHQEGHQLASLGEWKAARERGAGGTSLAEGVTANVRAQAAWV